MTTDFLVKKIIAVVLSISLFVPFIAFAQTTDVPLEPAVPETSAEAVLPSEPVVVPETSTQTNEPVVQDTAPVVSVEEIMVSEPTAVQETAPTQEAVTADALEGTANPEEATSTESTIIPLVDATATEPVVEEIAVEAAPEQAPDEIPVAAVSDLTIVADSLTPAVTTVGEEFVALKDSNETLDPDYVLAVSGKTIPTKKQGVVGQTSVTTPVQTSVDAETGIMTVSGSCSSMYYVVLLFRNQTDYDTDPRSFIVNRAYPCENGSFSYSIDRLPSKIANGTYYLMIGEQGESGAWTPASGLTEVSINRSN